jgi:hypothetical protein
VAGINLGGDMKQFVLRIQTVRPGDNTWVDYEEAETIEQAEKRAAFVRHLGAKVEIYRLL